MDVMVRAEETGMDEDEREAFASDVIGGLSKDSKSIPCKWFYDLRGSELFEEITRLDEYYPTRTEIALLDTTSTDMGVKLPSDAWIVEFGSGSSRKSDLFLKGLRTPKGYIPIDVSGDFLEAAAEALADRLPHLEIRPIIADFTGDIALPADMHGDQKIGFFPGSTIGNFEPAQAAKFLERARHMLGNNSHMVIGVDLKKDIGRLLDAYDDAQGVTADFNLNLLDRINRELDGEFDRDRFRHAVRYDPDEGRVEMHLESKDAQVVEVDGKSFSFKAGETIHTENSYKYAIDEFSQVANRAGWSRVDHWTDPEKLFSIHLLKAA